jgi:hypothetical protein
MRRKADGDTGNTAAASRENHYAKILADFH